MPCHFHITNVIVHMSVVLFLLLFDESAAQVSISYKPQFDSQSTGESSATRGRLGGLVRFAPEIFSSNNGFQPTVPTCKNQFHQTAQDLGIK